MHYYELMIVCGLCGNVLLQGSPSSVKLNSPTLSVQGKQHIIKANQTLELQCKGKFALSWTYPKSVKTDKGRPSIKEYRCGKKNQLYCSSLVLDHAVSQETGPYKCRYSSKKGKRQTSVYVYIKDMQKPFVEIHKNIPEVLYMTEGTQLVVPCRVTSPDITVSLIKFPGKKLTPDGKNIIWNNKKGFIIMNANYTHIGLLSCETTVNNVFYSNNYLTHRQANTIYDVSLNVTSPVRLLKGQSLALSCIVKLEWNARVVITWDYPGKANNTALISNRIDQTVKNVISSVLYISETNSIDKGVYTCNVEGGTMTRKKNTTVFVYEKPFINLKFKEKPAIEVVAGEESYRISVKAKAFPTPTVKWFKDGIAADEKCARYKTDGYSLIIRDVTEEDAGNYTILLELHQYKIYKNLTVSLAVNVKPQIGEKAVSFHDPGIYLVGSKQTLICTAYGSPPPRIQWGWHPCTRNNSKGLCKLPASTKRTPVQLTTNSSRSGNRILSITERSEIIKGKNKTVGVLVIAEAMVSGVYRCLATNKVGKDRRNINFFITDTPNGFALEVIGDPTEGEDLSVACKVSRYLYSNITLHVRNKTEHPVSNLNTVVIHGEDSDTAYVKLQNVSQENSGTYVCTVRNLQTGEEVSQEQHINIVAQEAPRLLHGLTNQTVNVSSTIILECPATGIPYPQISWYKNSQRLQQGPGIILTVGSKSLIIERVKEDDEGMYRCEAVNRKGSVKSTAYLNVQTAFQSGVLAMTRRVDTTEKSNLELIMLTCTCVAATLFWLLLTLFIRKLKKPTSTETKTDYLSIIMDPGEVPLDEQCERLPYDASKWEFPRERLKLGKSLGRGAFGKVVQASAFGINKSSSCRTVAVKMLKEGATASEYKALMTELKILIHIGHHLNVVNLLGACTKYGGPLMVIVEYCKYGNLSNYLKGKRDVFLQHKETHVQDEQSDKSPVVLPEVKKEKLCSLASSASTASSGFEEDKSLSDVEEEEEDSNSLYNKPIVMEDLISYSFQVARGMEFLASRKCIHRDLAARNILLSENNVVKICDFGLARDIYKDPDYVRKGDARLPLKWMAPESIFDKVYTTQSDVWSYGVLLWEIFSLGASPYPGLQIDEDFCNRLKEGTRMRAPEYATPEVYKIMLACWENDPKERPTFSELVKQLGDLLQANVQQDGKDYIPLNTILKPMHTTGGTNSFSSERSLTEETVDAISSCETSQSFGYINTRRSQSVKTFEEFILQDRKYTDDYQTDSGMVLASEELKCLLWNSSKPKQSSHSFGFRGALQSKESTNCCPKKSSCTHRNEEQQASSATELYSPPPDYNSALFYPPI
ncbi:vascular endothelial growth factor receptor 1 isoform X2 [Polypterus senegalus]|uniref:vascular endothelial growth factor receptor 1 isoform X2 n=1 Tax=Polypterus senegalus TaxID=55291 RepID=UPI00196364A4|nr:vascular endothelial growth factor receptor 1 isoform X2 [Polypterus senegalus]